MIGSVTRWAVTLGAVLAWTAPAAHAQVFTPGYDGALAMAGAGKPVVADFDGDGDADFAARGAFGTIDVRLSDGHGSFTRAPATPQTGTTAIRELVTADFNGDGRPDLALLDAVDRSLSVLLGRGDGAFTLRSGRPRLGHDPRGLTAADFNLDGLADLVAGVGHADGLGGVAFYPGAGNGSFGPAVESEHRQLTPTVVAGAMLGRRIGVAQIPVRDLVAYDWYAGQLLVYRNDGSGGFTAQAGVPFEAAPELTVADLTADGVDDVAMALPASDAVAVMHGMSGVLGQPQAVPVGDGPQSVAVVANGTFPDLAVANTAGHSVTYLRNSGGTLSTAPGSPFSTGPGTLGPNGIASGDFNADGLPDLVTANLGSQNMSPLFRSGTAVSAVAIQCTPSSGPVNVPVTCTAAVVDAGLSRAPAGTVRFVSDATGTFPDGDRCTLAPSGSFSSTCSRTYTPGEMGDGSHALSAAYSGGGGFSMARDSTQLAVVKRPTAVTVACSPASLKIRSATTCTATVADDGDAASAHTPTGTVTWTAAGGTIAGGGTCATTPVGGDDGAGRCSVTFTPATPAAAQPIGAAYGGSGAHAAASGSGSYTATRRDQTLTVSCAPGAVAPGTPTTCTATSTADAPVGVVPSGTVTFSRTGTGTFDPAASCLLAAVAGSQTAASCQVDYTPGAPAGAQTIGASLTSDATFAAPGDASAPIFVSRPTAASLACPPEPAPIGVAVTCAVTVADTGDSAGASAPSGAITVASGDPGTIAAPAGCTLAATGAAASGCTVTYTATAAGTGTHALSTGFAGNATHAASSGSGTLAVTRRASATTLACADAGAALGTTRTCTATVADTDAGTPAVPAGTVALAGAPGDRIGPPCTLAPVSATAAACDVVYAPGSAGDRPRTVTATYGGGATHLAGAAGTQLVPFGRRATATTLICTPRGVLAGARATCTVTVADTGRELPSTPTGLVTLGGSFGGASCTLAATDTPGVASCTSAYTATAAGSGTHALSAAYDGDLDHDGSSASTTLAVAAPATAPPPSPGPPVATVTRRTLKVAGGRLELPLTCTGAGAAVCTGKLTIATRVGKRQRTIATARYDVDPGETWGVELRITRAARTLVAARAKGIAATARIGTGTAVSVRLQRGRKGA